jgi:hypothetical protein
MPQMADLRRGLLRRARKIQIFDLRAEQPHTGDTAIETLTPAAAVCRAQARQIGVRITTYTSNRSIDASPPVDSRFGAEFVRVNIDAALQQEQKDGGWLGRLDRVYLPGRSDSPVVEAELVERGMKWSPVKMYAKTFPKGRGPTSNWRLAIEYLTRSGEEMPDDGVPLPRF